MFQPSHKAISGALSDDRGQVDGSPPDREPRKADCWPRSVADILFADLPTGVSCSGPTGGVPAKR